MSTSSGAFPGWCFFLYEPESTSLEKKTCEGLAHPESSLTQITDYCTSSQMFQHVFAQHPPKYVQKRYPPTTSSSQSQGTVWLSILPPLVEHSPQIPTKPSLRMLSTVAPPGSGLEPRGWQGGTTLPCTAPGVKPWRVVVGW